MFLRAISTRAFRASPTGSNGSRSITPAGSGSRRRERTISGFTSDDGSKLYIDDRLVIDNDGIHSAVTLVRSTEMTHGVHRIRVSYFQGPRDEVALMLAGQSRGLERHRRGHGGSQAGKRK